MNSAVCMHVYSVAMYSRALDFNETMNEVKMHIVNFNLWLSTFILCGEPCWNWGPKIIGHAQVFLGQLCVVSLVHRQESKQAVSVFIVLGMELNLECERFPNFLSGL